MNGIILFVTILNICTNYTALVGLDIIHYLYNVLPYYVYDKDGNFYVGYLLVAVTLIINNCNNYELNCDFNMYDLCHEILSPQSPF